MVHVIVTMRIKEGRMQEFLAACKELRPLVLKEKGCLAYDYTRDTESPRGPLAPLEANRITLLERWESLEALKAHLATPHMKASGDRMKVMREGEELRFTESIF